MNRHPIKNRNSLANDPRNQRGIALILFTIGMLVVIGIAGLALDISYLMLNKGRLQNVVDAAALAGARTLLDTKGDMQAATDTATRVLNANKAAKGNRAMTSGFSAGDVTIDFSADLEPFESSSIDADNPAEYVRVTVRPFTLSTWFLRVFEKTDPVTGQKSRINQMSVGGSAVAGPSPSLGQVCDLVPLIICGDPAAGPPTFGYADDEVHVLKGGSETGSQSGPIGPGNFQVARMDASGASEARANLAGGFEGCANLGATIDTEPGNMVGPVAQGINTRLNKYAGPIRPQDYPPDVVVDEPSSELTYNDDTGNIEYGGNPITDSSSIDFNYDAYETKVAAGPPYTNNGEFNRRTLAVTIANCGAGNNSGQSALPIMGFGCFFLLQEVKQKGNEAEMYGEFVEDCDAKGVSGPAPTTDFGPKVIQLYNNPDSVDS